jgi:hypothetical protein
VKGKINMPVQKGPWQTVGVVGGAMMVGDDMEKASVRAGEDPQATEEWDTEKEEIVLVEEWDARGEMKEWGTQRETALVLI